MYNKQTKLILLLVCVMHLFILGMLLLTPEKTLMPAAKPQPISVTFVQATAKTLQTPEKQRNTVKNKQRPTQPISKPAMAQLKTQQHKQTNTQEKTVTPSKTKKSNTTQLLNKQLPNKQLSNKQPQSKQTINAKPNAKPKKNQTINPVVVNQPMQHIQPFERELLSQQHYIKSIQSKQLNNTQNNTQNNFQDNFQNNAKNNAQNDAKNNTPNNASSNNTSDSDASNNNTKTHDAAQTTINIPTSKQDSSMDLNADQENEILDSFLIDDLDIQQNTSLAENQPNNVTTGAVFKYKVTPDYPKKEWINAEEGVVLFEFTVNEQGKVIPESINVISATTVNFLAAAKAALLTSEFYPHIENGVAKKQHARHREVFNIQLALAEQYIQKDGESNNKAKNDNETKNPNKAKNNDKESNIKSDMEKNTESDTKNKVKR